ncbi:MAG: aminodeoxychorismate/anthranilate synthase component II [Gemmatimonadota bacterium]
MILVLDHDDSFVHTLASYAQELGASVVVRRVHDLEYPEVAALEPAGIILSPGPGTPERCTLAVAVVRGLGMTTPILGVCLGHQVIAAAFGAVVERAARPRHGMTSLVSHDGMGIFAGLPTPLEATRYHSLTVRRDSLPAELVRTAVADDDGAVMGVRHRLAPIEGVQFHPESVLTRHGMAMIGSFLARCR